LNYVRAKVSSFKFSTVAFFSKRGSKLPWNPAEVLKMKKVLILTMTMVIFLMSTLCCGCTDADAKASLEEVSSDYRIERIELSQDLVERGDTFTATLIGAQGIGWSEIEWIIDQDEEYVMAEKVSLSEANIIKLRAIRISNPKKVKLTAIVKTTGDKFYYEFMVMKRTEGRKEYSQ
jgi:hypothetical protein